MLVTFHSEAYPDIPMFGDVAAAMLRMMGHSGTIPGAILAEDVPAALANLKAALESPAGQAAVSGGEDDDDQPRVSLATRGYTLVQMLEAAARKGCDVMWR